MKTEYMIPDLEVTELELREVILSSLPTESGNELPILTKRIVSDELNGDPNLDPEDLLSELSDNG